MSVLPRNPFLRYPCFLNPHLGAIFSEFLSSESISPESMCFRNPCFQNPFFSFFCRNPFYRNPIFGIHFFGIMVFGIHFFRNLFRHLGKNEKMSILVYHFVCKWCEDFGIHFFGATHFGVFFGGGGVVGRLSIQFGGGGWQLHWVWLGFWDLAENVRGCVGRSSRIMAPKHRNPVPNSKERQFYKLRLVLFIECMVPTLQGIIVGNVLNNMSVSVKHTSQRSNQRYLYNNKIRKRTPPPKKKNKVLRGTQGVQQPSVKL